MVVRQRQNHITSDNSPTTGNRNDVQEVRDGPFQSTANPSSLSLNSLSSTYDMISRSEIPQTPALPTTLSALPAELLLLIAQHLQYPDLLALRHTHPRFLNTKLLATSNRIHKVDWLLDRHARGLDVPMHSGLRMDSDAAFCSQAEVREIMQRRLRHGECRAGKAGCLLVEGWDCGGGEKRRIGSPWRSGRRRKWMGDDGGRMLWVGVLVGVLAVLVVVLRSRLDLV